MEGQKRQKGNLWLIVLLAVLAIMIVGLVIGIIVINVTKDSSEQAGGGETEEVDTSEQFSAEQIKSVIEETDRAISEAGANEEKAAIYADRAGQLFNLSHGGGGYVEMILSDAYKAEELAPTAYTAYYIYVYEDAFGNSEKAEEYLRIAQARGFIEGNGEG